MTGFLLQQCKQNRQLCEQEENPKRNGFTGGGTTFLRDHSGAATPECFAFQGETWLAVAALSVQLA